MTLSLPPKYALLPISVLKEAVKPDKPDKPLFFMFVQLIALAWENQYERTPKLREDELYNVELPDGTKRFGYLKIGRREYFTLKREMELLGWLRSTRPSVGFVQFSFPCVANIPAESVASAENCIEVQKTALDELRIEEEESIEFKKQESSSSSSLKQSEVRKTALTAGEVKMQQLLENLHLLFEPETHGVLDIRPVLLAGIPERALAWIAKAYQERQQPDRPNGLATPIGVIVKHVLERDEPNRYYLSNYHRILPEAYLEAVREIEYSCDHCAEHFDKRAELDEHVKEFHHICIECGRAFDTQELEKAHYADKHDPYRKPRDPAPIAAPALDGTVGTAWVNVLKLLQEEMPRASFDTWVRDTAPVRYCGNAVEIGTRNAYARDWLASRLTAKTQELLSQVMKQEVVVKFVVATDSLVEEIK